MMDNVLMAGEASIVNRVRFRKRVLVLGNWECHCNNGTTCDSVTGECSDGQCADGWGGIDCQQVKI